MARPDAPLCALLLLITLGLLTTETTAACCSKYDKIVNPQLPIAKLKGYSIQTTRGSCRIKAIVFITMKNITICGDPSDHRVVHAVKVLGNKAAHL